MTTIQDRGHKHTCLGCATRFFDLGKRPIACPKCNQRVAAVIAPVRRKRRVAGDSANATQHTAMVVAPTLKPTK